VTEVKKFELLLKNGGKSGPFESQKKLGKNRRTERERGVYPEESECINKIRKMGGEKGRSCKG